MPWNGCSFYVEYAKHNMLSPEQRKRLQEMTPEELRRFALLALKKRAEKRSSLKDKPQQK